MFWVILLSAWGGFLLGVLFMALLSLAREKQKYSEAGEKDDPLPENENAPARGAAVHRPG